MRESKNYQKMNSVDENEYRLRFCYWIQRNEENTKKEIKSSMIVFLITIIYLKYWNVSDDNIVNI